MHVYFVNGVPNLLHAIKELKKRFWPVETEHLFPKINLYIMFIFYFYTTYAPTYVNKHFLTKRSCGVFCIYLFILAICDFY